MRFLDTEGPSVVVTRAVEEGTSRPIPKKREGTTYAPFVLSKALPVVSAKLVHRILRAEYIDMAELLCDNIEVERRTMLADGVSAQGHLSN